MKAELRSFNEAPAGIVRGDTLEARQEGERHQRAMPLTRLLGNGMEYDDALRLHSLSGQGYAWHEVGEWLGERNLRRAESALAEEHWLSARTALRRATACFRFAQSALQGDSDTKRALYRKLVAAFGRAVALDVPPGEKLDVPYRGSRLSAWLLRPRSPEPPPVVIVFGGADGWREEYQEGARHLLERGVAVLLAELPGQGETRLLNGLYFEADIDRAVGALLDVLYADRGLAPRVGIWGNSMGGSFAAWAASVDSRLAACCVNGGSATPVEVVERFPAIVAKLEAMVGPAGQGRAVEMIGSLSLIGERNRIRCPLLVLHGEPDRIFLIENARRLCEEAPSTDKQFIAWDDGEHCLYNHSEEKHCLVADWFASRLSAAAA